MAKTRIALHELLVSVLGSENVYFQPPESLQLRFPAIIYSRSELNNRFADNSVYSRDNAYEVIVVDQNPDSEIVQRISELPFCRFNRHYRSDHMNHDVFTIYF